MGGVRQSRGPPLPEGGRSQGGKSVSLTAEPTAEGRGIAKAFDEFRELLKSDYDQRRRGLIVHVHNKVHAHPKSMEEMQAEVQTFVEMVVGKREHQEKMVFSLVNTKKEGELSRLLGRKDLLGAPEFILSSNTIHSVNRHSNLTIGDWGVLPVIANEYEAAFLLKSEQVGRYPRILFFLSRGHDEAFAYVGEVVGGGARKPRINVITFYKDHPNTILAHAKERATDPESVAQFQKRINAPPEGGLPGSPARRP